MSLLNFIENYELRAMVGSVILVGGCACMWLFMYKYMVCKEKNNKIKVLAVRTYDINHNNKPIVINIS